MMMYEVFCEGRASYLFFTEEQAQAWLKSHDDGFGYAIRPFYPAKIR